MNLPYNHSNHYMTDSFHVTYSLIYLTNSSAFKPASLKNKNDSAPVLPPHSGKMTSFTK